MERKMSSSIRSPSYEPEEKEISDDDDDDRNHKHRRREAVSQSLERDVSEQLLTMPYRKWNKRLGNKHSYRGNDSQSFESRKNYNIPPLEKDLSTKFEMRRPGFTSISQAHSSQILGLNQSGDSGPGRGGGRQSGSWSQHHSRIGSVDIASHMVQRGSVPYGLSAGRGVSNVFSEQSSSWSTCGLVPVVPNVGLDTLHPLGLPGSFRPPINPSLGVGIPRQRCRDFEERGFCLRGDMCPMEHGMNRIVVEDVQSLTQFNLPLTLPSAHLMVTPAGPGPLPAISAPSSILTNSKGGNLGLMNDGLEFNGVFGGSAVTNGADLYDPDQPLWASDCPETSNVLNPSNVTLLDIDPSDHHDVGLNDGFEKEHLPRSTGTALGSQSTTSSVWGRIGGSKNRSDLKDKNDSAILKNEKKEDQEQSNSAQGAVGQKKYTNMDDVGSQSMNSSLKPQSVKGRDIRKPSQKALRTVFVNGIPLENNKREALLSHFGKFGEVIDIYIPSNSGRAFVQFSKREDAEAALKAPDAVMGNRFIKLWWANRDSIPDDGVNSANTVPVTPNPVAVASAPPPTISVTNKGNSNLQAATSKGSIAEASLVPLPSSDQPKPSVSNGPKALPPSQKKLVNLELLKEELRKKQEMLDKKRNEFKSQLNKLEKQATVLKGDGTSNQAVVKRRKVETTADVSKDATPTSMEPRTVLSSEQAEVTTADNGRTLENVEPHDSKCNAVVPQGTSTIKHPIRPLAHSGPHLTANRFKLDNRPTTFKIIPPLPVGLANVSTLKDHFSNFGDISTLELEDATDKSKDAEMSKGSARISFTNRRSAEKAFMNGKSWQGHNLQFAWVTTSSKKVTAGTENPSRSCEEDATSAPAPAQPAEKAAAATGYSEEAVASGTVGSENCIEEEDDSFTQSLEQREDIQSSSTAVNESS